MLASSRTHSQTFLNLLRLICRTFWRDWLAKELFLLFVAIILAVSALSSVALLADRFKQGIELESNQLIAADLRLRSDRPIHSALVSRAYTENLMVAETINFPSMVNAAANSLQHSSSIETQDILPARLAAIKAVSENYPLRGNITLASAKADDSPIEEAQLKNTPFKNKLALKTVWVDAPLLQSLNIKIGDKIKVGQAELTIADVIQREPDRGLAWINFSPRVMMRVEDLAETGLLAMGSRATYYLLVAGSKPNIANYKAWLDAINHQSNDKVADKNQQPTQSAESLNTSAHAASHAHAHANTNTNTNTNTHTATANNSNQSRKTLSNAPSNFSLTDNQTEIQANVSADKSADVSANMSNAARALENIHIETVADNQAQFEEIFVRSERFLSLTSLLAAIMSAVAIGLSSQRFAKRHTQSAALLRCMGIGKQTLKCLYVGEYAVLGAIAGLIGVGLGMIFQYFLLQSVQAWLVTPLPLPTVWPAIQAWLAGITLLFAFGLPPLLIVAQTPPIAVLRRADSPIDYLFFKLYLPGVIVFAAILLWVAGDWKLGAAVMISCIAGLVWFILFGNSFLTLLQKIALRLSASKLFSAFNSGALFFMRYVLQTMQRRRRLTLIQMTSLATALLSLFLLSAISHDLVKGWQQSVPENFPNRFLVDIQPSQAASVSQALNRTPFADTNPDTIQLSPIIRARLVSHNQQPIDINQYPDARTKQMLTREFNLSYCDDLPSDNRVVAGKWFDPQVDQTHNEISITENIAKRLYLKLGDTLVFEVAGAPIQFKITSLRVVDWTTFRPNFFMLTTPNALKDLPANYLASFFLTEKGQIALDNLIKNFPNLTAIDITVILNQLQNIILQITKVIEILFLFTLGASVLVLITAFAHSHEARVYEVSLLRTLGASLKQIFLIQLFELSIVGLIAGILAGISAQAGVLFLAHFIFKFDLTLNLWLLLGGPIVGWLSAVIAGWPMCRRILNNPPSAFLNQ